MRVRRASFFVLLGIMLVVFMAALQYETASAQKCYNQQQQEIPCPGPAGEKPTKTPINYPSFTPTLTDTPEPTKTPLVTNTPDPTEVALWCANFSSAGNAPQPNPSPKTSPFMPFALGGGGLLLGVLIGLLIAGVIGPGMSRGIVGPDIPGELLPAVDMFHKTEDAGGNFFKYDRKGPADSAGTFMKEQSIKGQADVNGDNTFAKFHDEAALGVREAALNVREAALNAREAALNAREAASGASNFKKG